MWALLMGIVHDMDSFFSLHHYQDAQEWQYAEFTKRLKMLATLIYADKAQGRYIKQVDHLQASIWSSPYPNLVNYHVKEAQNE